MPCSIAGRMLLWLYCSIIRVIYNTRMAYSSLIDLVADFDSVFVCGILYERFSVNGMRSQRIGTNTGYGNEGDYIANPRNMTALVPTFDAAQNLAWVCLTSAYDVAQFVVRALDMPVWEQEMSMYGERMTVNGLVEVIRACRSKCGTLCRTRDLLLTTI
jgi:hypothetical protein